MWRTTEMDLWHLQPQRLNPLLSGCYNYYYFYFYISLLIIKATTIWGRTDSFYRTKMILFRSLWGVGIRIDNKLRSFVVSDSIRQVMLCLLAFSKYILYITNLAVDERPNYKYPITNTPHHGWQLQSQNIVINQLKGNLFRYAVLGNMEAIGGGDRGLPIRTSIFHPKQKDPAMGNYMHYLQLLI